MKKLMLVIGFAAGIAFAGTIQKAVTYDGNSASIAQMTFYPADKGTVRAEIYGQVLQTDAGIGYSSMQRMILTGADATAINTIFTGTALKQWRLAEGLEQ